MHRFSDRLPELHGVNASLAMTSPLAYKLCDAIAPESNSRGREVLRVTENMQSCVYFPQRDIERTAALRAKEEGPKGLFESIQWKKTDEENPSLSNRPILTTIRTPLAIFGFPAS